MRNRKIKILFIMVVLCAPLTILNAEGLFHDLSSVKTDRFKIDDKLPWDAIQQLLDLLYKDEQPSPKHRGICFRSKSGIIDSDSLAKVERISLVVKDGSNGWRAFERIVGESGWHYQTSRARTQINMWPGTNFNGYDHLQHSEECKKAFKEHMIDGFELTTSYVESIDTLFREIRMKDKKFQYNIFSLVSS